MKKSIRLLTKITPVVILFLLFFTFSCQKQGTEVITEEEMKAIAERTLEIWNEGNLDLIGELYAPELVRHECDLPEDVVGFDAFKNLVTWIRTQFPDFYMMVDEMIVKGDRMVMRWTMTGTNTGSLGDLPPTGKNMRVSGISIARLVNGKIAEVWDFYNQLDMLQQLGFTLTPPQVQEPQ